ncbi:hypothetical protein CAC42_3822 [Sphaceloma murrayae]|uniref:Uncharacterized protein n=1 Tax=Sphaceloma murrayae TaxID=2082308 RepID=A0A2K1QH99_9PEZI|nr:hypothetical protein CAC42_3822 [Sphaceloma murrayae]
MVPNGSPAPLRVQVVCLNEDTETAWCYLPEEEEILLLAPLVSALRQHCNGDGLDMDVFEPLARAMRRKHPGLVRRVNYTPKDGVTDEHAMRMDETATVLLVICEPVGLEGEALTVSIRGQCLFAYDAMKEYEKIHEGTEPPALVVLYCGKRDFQGVSNIETCFRCEDYSGRDWDAVADRLFKGIES